MKVFLCEKPSQAKDVGKVLGVLGGSTEGYYQKDNTVVTWAFGHLLTQAMPEAYGEQFKQFGNIEALPILPENWIMEVPKNNQKQLNVIKKLLSKADEVVIATDADREGEVIGREILEFCKYRGKISRLWLQALDPASVKKGLANLLPGVKKEPLYRAGLARSRADWLIGMNLSRAYTVAYSAGFGKEHTLSIGRVQTPTLSLVVHRDHLIEHFVPYSYFILQPEFQNKAGSRFKASWCIPEDKKNVDGHCTDKAFVEDLASQLNQPGVTGLIDSVQTERKRTPAPLPYSLPALQKEASSRFRVPVNKVLDVAQSLYEKYKVTSYPRTSCRYLPLSQKGDVPAVLQAMLKLDPSIEPLVSKANPNRDARVWNDKQVAKDSHHAIIPTMVSHADLSAMTKLERDIYDMIRRRYLAQFYPDYEYDSTLVVVAAVSHRFMASGTVVCAAGWKALSQDDEQDDDGSADVPAKLPLLKENESVVPVAAEASAKETSPPARFTEATLLAEMQSLKSVLVNVEDAEIKKVLRDTEGLGTGATRGNIIEKLLEMAYLAKDKKGSLSATLKGKGLIAAVPPMIADPITTAKWELALFGIEHGQIDYDYFMSVQTDLLEQLISDAKAVAKQRPERARPAPAKKPVFDVKTGDVCPICKKGTLSVKTMKKAPDKPFLGCSNYPCKFLQWFTK